MSRADGPAALERPHGVPDAVWRAVESVRDMPRLDGVRYREIPVSSSLADFGIGVELSCEAGPDPAQDAASGWIMTLYSARPRSDWRSRWRCVAFARLPLDGGANDCLTPAMYWDDMMDMLGAADPDDVKGTVTVARNTSFGEAPDEPHVGCEMRVSWTPTETPDGVDAGGQVMAWARFLRASLRDDERETLG